MALELNLTAQSIGTLEAKAGQLLSNVGAWPVDEIPVKELLVNEPEKLRSWLRTRSSADASQRAVVKEWIVALKHLERLRHLHNQFFDAWPKVEVSLPSHAVLSCLPSNRKGRSRGASSGSRSGLMIVPCPPPPSPLVVGGWRWFRCAVMERMPQAFTMFWVLVVLLPSLVIAIIFITLLLHPELFIHLLATVLRLLPRLIDTIAARVSRQLSIEVDSMFLEAVGNAIGASTHSTTQSSPPLDCPPPTSSHGSVSGWFVGALGFWLGRRLA